MSTISPPQNSEANPRVKAIFDEIDCSWLCIDIANGYISNFVEYCAKARELFQDKIIIALPPLPL